MELLFEYIKKMQKEGAESWLARFEKEYGITLNQMREIAEAEAKQMEKDLGERMDSTEEKIALGIVGGIFMGLAAMVCFQEDMEKFSKQLDNLNLEAPDA